MKNLRKSTSDSYVLCKHKFKQWRGESEAAGRGGSPIDYAPLPPPSPVILVCLLVCDACHVVSTTCDDRRSLCNTFGWTGVLQAPPPQQFHGRALVEVRGLAPWKLQRICILRYLNQGLILHNNTWMVMHFFMCIAVQSHRNSQRSKIFNFQVSYQKKKCMFCSSSWTIFLKFERQAI